VNLLQLLYLLVITSFLVVIFVFDLKHYIIPDKVIWPAIGVTFFYRFSALWNFNNWNLFGIWNLEFGNLESLILPIISSVGAATFFLLIVLVSRGRWMGLGDVKLAVLMGLFLGWPNILAALILAFFVGAVVGIGLMITGRKTLKSKIPFGPFLVLGTFAALLFGNELINWYLNLFLM
jgi:leader peptidase (prepilin peptidase)/N-methyltransferase